jgi:hypothetical protein
MTLDEDGTFTWVNCSQGGATSMGTWTSDATTLTFSYVEDQVFCPGGTLTWEYQLDGSTLMSHVVANTCSEQNGGTWEFERQT